MKKVLSLVLALVMVASLCTVAFAEGSKTKLFEVIEANKPELAETLNYTVSETEVEPATDEQIAAAIAAAAAEDETLDVDADKLTLSQMDDYTVDEYPCILTIYGEGTEEVEVVVLVKYEDADEWFLGYCGLAGEFEVEVEAAGTLAIYVVA